jgi:hypothetical protein
MRQRVIPLLPAVRQAATTASRIEKAKDRKGKKKVPAGGSHVGTKVGVWEVRTLAQNSKAVGSRSDSSQDFLARFFGKIFWQFFLASSLRGFCGDGSPRRIRRHPAAPRRMRTDGCAMDWCTPPDAPARLRY